MTERGVALESGAELEADVVVTATGLEMVPFGGIQLTPWPTLESYVARIRERPAVKAALAAVA